MPLEAAISFGCEHCAERQGISPTQERHHNLMWFDKKDNYLGCSRHDIAASQEVCSPGT
jgi:hypothetical protein